jgi:preprotein translocase subunit SecG
MDGVFQTIKTNFLYVTMFLILVTSLVYQFINKSDEADSQRPKKGSSFYLALFGGIFFIIILIIYLIKNSKGFQKDAQENPVVEQSRVGKVSEEEYKKQTEENTKREIEKLMQCEKFKKLKAVKGEDPKNYNWQIADKAKKTVYRENEDSDDSDDSLSKVQ